MGTLLSGCPCLGLPAGHMLLSEPCLPHHAPVGGHLWWEKWSGLPLLFQASLLFSQLGGASCSGAPLNLLHQPFLLFVARIFPSILVCLATCGLSCVAVVPTVPGTGEMSASKKIPASWNWSILVFSACSPSPFLHNFPASPHQRFPSLHPEIRKVLIDEARTGHHWPRALLLNPGSWALGPVHSCGPPCWLLSVCFQPCSPTHKSHLLTEPIESAPDFILPLNVALFQGWPFSTALTSQGLSLIRSLCPRPWCCTQADPSSLPHPGLSSSWLA